MTTEDDLDRKVSEVLAREARATGPVTGRTTLGEGGLGLTSLGLVRAFVALEDALGRELDDAVILAAELETVSDVVDLLRRPSGTTT